MMRSVVIGAMVLAAATAHGYVGISHESQGPFSRLGLLDPSRLSMQQTIVVGYASGSGNREGHGAFLTTVGYSFGPRLALRATLSKEFSFLGQGRSDEGISLSELRLDWAPSKHFSLHLSFSSPPTALRDPRSTKWH